MGSDSGQYKKAYRDPKVLKKLYWEQDNSLATIADIIDCGTSTVQKWMDHHGIPRRMPDDEKYPRPRTQSEYGSEAGYETIVHHHGDDKYQVSHHRLIAVSEWGFDAVSGTHVHHCNGIEWDNRPENLKLFSVENHARFHRNQEPNNEPWHDKFRLYEEYVKNDLSMQQIAEKWDCDAVTIHNWLHRHNIPTRNRAGEFEVEV